MGWEGLNRRRFPRAEFPSMVKVIHSGKGEGPVLTHTENIASGGMCVILRKAMDLFSSVDVEIDLLDGEVPISCAGKVVWSVRRKAIEKEKPSFYDIGIEFVDMKDDARKRIERAIAHLVRSSHKTNA
ncbi:MAG: PilZ domain-containing protein [Candidatus Omnitrophica bacterium]|nr:PilZ domain-containing protein [Candidatus Omnitrophota bacterium]